MSSIGNGDPLGISLQKRKKSTGIWAPVYDIVLLLRKVES